MRWRCVSCAGAKARSASPRPPAPSTHKRTPPTCGSRRPSSTSSIPHSRAAVLAAFPRCDRIPVVSTTDRRRSDRIPIEMWVEQSRDQELYFQRSANLSAGGLFLENTIPHPVGTRITLQFTLPGDAEALRVHGEIVSAAQTNELGMGVKFVEVEPAVQAGIDAFIASRK